MTEQELCEKAKELMQYVLPQAIKAWKVWVDPIPLEEGNEKKFLVEAYSGRFHITTELTETAIETATIEELRAPTHVHYEAIIHTTQPTGWTEVEH